MQANPTRTMYTTEREIRFESRDETPPQIRVLAHASDFWENHILGVFMTQFDPMADEGVSPDSYECFVDGNTYVVRCTDDDDNTARELMDGLVMNLERQADIFTFDELTFEFNVEGTVDTERTGAMIHVLRESGLDDSEIVDEIPWLSGSKQTTRGD